MKQIPGCPFPSFLWKAIISSVVLNSRLQRKIITYGQLLEKQIKNININVNDVIIRKADTNYYLRNLKLNNRSYSLFIIVQSLWCPSVEL